MWALRIYRCFLFSPSTCIKHRCTRVRGSLSCCHVVYLWCFHCFKVCFYPILSHPKPPCLSEYHQSIPVIHFSSVTSTLYFPYSLLYLNLLCSPRHSTLLHSTLLYFTLLYFTLIYFTLLSTASSYHTSLWRVQDSWAFGILDPPAI